METCSVSTEVYLCSLDRKRIPCWETHIILIQEFPKAALVSKLLFMKLDMLYLKPRNVQKKLNVFIESGKNENPLFCFCNTNSNPAID